MFFKFDEFLTAQMHGDVNYRLPSIVDAMTYTNAGVKTYLYYQGILTFPSYLQSILQFSFWWITFVDNNQTSNRRLHNLLYMVYRLEFQTLVKTTSDILLLLDSFRMYGMAHLMERSLHIHLVHLDSQKMDR